MTPDEAQLIVSTYIPYVGAVTRWGGVKVGVIGFPWVLGNVQYRETLRVIQFTATGNYRNGYFLEAFAEVGRQMGVVYLSGFATYTLLHAVGDFDLLSNLLPGEILIPAILSGPYSWDIDRQNWIVGGKAVIGFNSPL